MICISWRKTQNYIEKCTFLFTDVCVCRLILCKFAVAELIPRDWICINYIQPNLHNEALKIYRKTL